MFFPSKEEVNRIKQNYQTGDRVELVFMDDSQAPPIGTKGTVRFVDDAGTIHVSWDTGSSLGVTYPEDKCKKIK